MKGRIVIAAILFTFLFSPAVVMSADIGIMGLILGKSLKECGIQECKVNRMIGNWKSYELKNDALCWQDRTSSYHKEKRQPSVFINSRAYLSFPTESRVIFKNNSGHVEADIIQEIIVWMNPDFAPEMLDLLTKKYGEPAGHETSIVQNKMGARFERFFCSWNIEGHLIVFDSRFSVDQARLKATHKDVAGPEMEKYLYKKSQDKNKI
jgi:hypothetical protein